MIITPGIIVDFVFRIGGRWGQAGHCHRGAPPLEVAASSAAARDRAEPPNFRQQGRAGLRTSHCVVCIKIGFCVLLAEPGPSAVGGPEQRLVATAHRRKTRGQLSRPHATGAARVYLRSVPISAILGQPVIEPIRGYVVRRFRGNEVLKIDAY